VDETRDGPRPNETLRFTFVIPVRTDAARLGACLATLRALDYPAALVDVIVADNGSTDDSAQVAISFGCRVVSLPGLPVAAVRNRAAAAARGDVLAFVDADHLLAPGWLRSAAETLSQDGVAACGAPYGSPAASSWVQRMYGAFRDHRVGIFDTDWLGSGNLAIRREVFGQVGGFDPSLETCEDVDLCRRLKGRGFRILTDSRMGSVHVGDPRTLRALFFGELWRGRDNIRVSVRPPVALRELPSIVIPVVDLLMLILAIAGPALGGKNGLWLTAGAMLTILLLSSLRAARMLGRLRERRSGDVTRAMAVALTYDLARALALVSRAGHGARRAQT
jgi:Glycosyl transferase family 2